MSRLDKAQEARLAALEAVLHMDAENDLDALVTLADYVVNGLDRKETDPPSKQWRPLDIFTKDDRKNLNDWTPTIESLFRQTSRPDLSVPTLTGATLGRLVEMIREGEDVGKDVQKRVEDVIVGERGEVRDWPTVRTKVREKVDGWHADAVEGELLVGERRGCDGCSRELERRREAGEAETTGPDDEPDATSSQPIGEDPGDTGILTAWTEAIRSRDAEREAEREGAELERRAGRDEALERGREKLRERRQSEGDGTGRDPLGSPLDDDEILAVAGTELYPASDEEPSREVKIRNRQGQVFAWAKGAGPRGLSGWTDRNPANPWTPRWAWTSLEMERRGPWHVV